jgi:hypothetical protein
MAISAADAAGVSPHGNAAANEAAELTPAVLATLQRQRPLPGNRIQHAALQQLLRKGVSAGTICEEEMTWCLKSWSDGFDLQADTTQLKGGVVHKNYGSAEKDRKEITEALKKRVERGQTQGPFRYDAAAGLPFRHYRTVPIGSVRKRLEPWVARPISDHSKTGLNETVTEDLEMSMEGLRKIMGEMYNGAYLGVQDVADAFPSLPIKPCYWPFMLILWYDINSLPYDDNLYVYVTTCGDFGVSSMPWTWTKFMDIFLRCLEAEGVPRPVSAYLDDLTRISKKKKECDKEMDIVEKHLADIGLKEKRLKRQSASQSVSSVLGADLRTVPRIQKRLPKEKAKQLMADGEAMLAANKVTKRQVSSYVGFLLHCLQLLPDYLTVFAGGIFALKRGFRPQQHDNCRRRVTAWARHGLTAINHHLRMHAGRWTNIYNQHHPRPVAEEVRTDAAGGQRTGGGYCTAAGHWRLWGYSGAAARKHITWKELHAVLAVVRDHGHRWVGCRVPIRCDNSSVVGAVRKKWTRSAAMDGTLQELYQLAGRYDLDLEITWISTHDNGAADALSRGDVHRFRRCAAELSWRVNARPHAPQVSQ